MTTPSGRIVSVRSDVSGDFAVVEVDTAVACARCAAGKGCGAGLLGQGSRRQVQALLPPGVELKSGDHVDLVLESGNVLRAAMLAYGLPLGGAIVLAAVGWILNLSEAGAVSLALIGLVSGVLAARHRLRRESCLFSFTPEARPRR